LKIGTPKDDADDKVSKNRQAHGERNGRAKLRQQDVDEVRRLYQIGGISQRALAKQFSVHHTTVRDILSGDIWAAA
jgi:DNA invertase Pin-like site-specific DNA recombinase